MWLSTQHFASQAKGGILQRSPDLQRVTTTRSGTEPQRSSQENTVASLSCISNRSKTIILPTAVVWVLNHSTGNCIQARAILDSGSMSNIVTLDFANKLWAPQNRINIPISSLGGNKTTVKSKLNTKIINGNS
ncbi:hypothetical protein TNCV_1148001 [Trichonephila clavipes]|nr:hypothetical protein TNCV_1148001 [Trichonephila clavipes]